MNLSEKKLLLYETVRRCHWQQNLLTKSITKPIWAHGPATSIVMSSQIKGVINSAEINMKAQGLFVLKNFQKRIYTNGHSKTCPADKQS